ncbi:MAG: hypothetical protein Q8K99_11120 [Actinomycetota bacterium]|nr:hypothetical protein [Actinomycetota bacterium]
MTHPDSQSDGTIPVREAVHEHVLADLRDVASRAADTATELYVAQEHESRNTRFDKALERACEAV